MVSTARRAPEELEKLVADPLVRESRQPGPFADRRGEAGGIRPVLRIFGEEAEETQDPQVILADALARIADEADPAGLEVRKTLRIVEEFAPSPERERVDREVAPAGVGREIAAEAHDGAASVGLDVLAQGRHLERLALDDHRHRAVLDARRNRLEPGGLGAPRHLAGERRRGAVDLVDGPPEESVADGAADDPRFLPAPVEDPEQGPRRGRSSNAARAERSRFRVT